MLEFPSLENVPLSQSNAQLTNASIELVSRLISSPIVSAFDAKPSSRLKDNELGMTSLTPVGDVVHIFSHIRKTYRVQWVVLEGSTDLPHLIPLADTGKSNKARKLSKGRKESSVSIGDTGENHLANSLWIPLAEVADAK